MTENEIVKQAIRCIVGACDETCKGYDAKESVCHGYSEVASGLETVLKDYEQYKEVGTVEEIQQKDEVIATQRDIIEGVYKDYEKYLKIGTIEEFKALKEKSVAKKPITYTHTHRADCPNCRATVRGIDKPFGDYCSKCGTKIDWSE